MPAAKVGSIYVPNVANLAKNALKSRANQPIQKGICDAIRHTFYFGFGIAWSLGP